MDRVATFGTQNRTAQPIVCKHFRKFGKCKYGENCRMSHDHRLHRDYVARNEVSPSSLDAYVKGTSDSILSAKLTSCTSDALWWHSKDNSADIDASDLRQASRDLTKKNTMYRFLYGTSKLLLVGDPTPLIDMGTQTAETFRIVGAFLDGHFDIDPRHESHQSFQMVLVPFVIVLTTSVAVSSGSPQIMSVYGAVLYHLEQFSQQYARCLQELINLGRLFPIGIDPLALATRNRHAFLPICFVQVILPMVFLLLVLHRKFGTSQENVSIRTTAFLLEKSIDKWREKLESKTLHTGHPNLESSFVHQRVSFELQRVLRSFRQIVDTSVVAESPCPVVSEWCGHTLTPPGRDRHDNDFLNISDIRIVPTQSELLCETPPAIPGNFLYTTEAHWLPPGPARHIDTHFRLLREDFLFEMRKTLQALLRFLNTKRRNDPPLETSRFKQRNANLDIDLFVYSVLKLSLYKGSIRDGVGFAVDFAEPTFLCERKKSERKAYWEKSPKLKNGNLGLLLLKSRRLNGDPLMFVGTIQERAVDRFVQESGRCSFVFVPDRSSGVRLLLQPSNKLLGEYSVYFIEFPLLFQGYRPFLTVLKRMNPDELPFADLICPSIAPKTPLVLEPPMYALTPSHCCDLSFLLRKDCGVTKLMLNIDASETNNTIRQQLHEYSTLDIDQADALISALTSRVCCIQGPPGTGKTYVGTRIIKAIVISSSQEHIRPILVVCYTNHALDQFLLSLVEAGITSICRLGKPKDERLAPFGLSQNGGVRIASSTIRATFQEIGGLEQQLGQVANVPLDGLLGEIRGELLDELREVESSIDTSDELIKEWLDGTCKPQPRWPPSLWAKSHAERVQHYGRLLERSKELQIEKCEHMIRRIGALKLQLQCLYQQNDTARLYGKQIIGATSTGVSSHIDSLKALNPKIVMIEEAAEVLEAHVLSCLLPSVQHLIMIGDHQQLRPKVATYELTTESREGKRFRLDMSMFERLQQGEFKFPISKIGRQRRMRPEISRIVRDLSYPHLVDDASVMHRPNIKGVRMNVIFFKHQSPEKGSEGDAAVHEKSHSNVFEAEMVDKLVQFLLFQEYAPNQIVVLTPYLGQLAQIRSLLSKTMTVVLENKDEEDVDKILGADDIELVIPSLTPNASLPQKGKSVDIRNLSQCIRVSSVDNYQGEENDIVIISMVRNRGLNREGSIGFLRTENRINVLLSRARCGMFIFGDAELLKSKSPLWQQVLGGLESKGSVLTHLPLFCQRLPAYEKFVTLPTDFTVFFPQGGCALPCEFRLPTCGHRCHRSCHSDRLDHRDVFCNQDCTRLHPVCNHLCPKLCGEECSPCKINVPVTLPCGHRGTYPCHLSPNPSLIDCSTVLSIVVAQCGHNKMVQCCNKSKGHRCNVKCAIALPCGHLCQAKCANCTDLTVRGLVGKKAPDNLRNSELMKHVQCPQTCGRALLCNHNCGAKCHHGGVCPPCHQPCDARTCSHSKCSSNCCEPCQGCAEMCFWSCEHFGQCTLPCVTPCVRPPCDKRCSLLLTCGHRCPSVCGEICPAQDFCQECGLEKHRGAVVDIFCGETYSEIILDDNPIVFLSCGHFFTMESMDGLMELVKFYCATPDGSRKPSFPGSDENLTTRRCPTCRTPIMTVKRYGRVIKKVALNAVDTQFIKVVEKKFAALESDFVKLLPESSTSTITLDTLKISNLQGRIKMFLNELNQMPSMQPYLRVSQLLGKYTQSEQTAVRADIDLAVRTGPQSHIDYKWKSHFLLLRVREIEFNESLNNLSKKRTNRDYVNSKLDPLKRKVIANLSLLETTCGGLKSQKLYKSLRQCKILNLSYLKLDISVHHLIFECCKSLSPLTNPDGKPEEGPRQDDLQNIRAKCDRFLKELAVVSKNDQISDGERVSLEHIEKWATEQLPTIRDGGSLSQEEWKEICNAMMRDKAEFEGFGFGSFGHFNRCPNGHPYFIGDCGGAMTRARCYECGEEIGGSNHQLLSTNTAEPLLNEMLSNYHGRLGV